MKKKKWTGKHSALAIVLAVVLLAVVVLAVLWLLPEAERPPVYTGNPQTPVEHPVAIDPALQNMGQAQSPEQVKTSEIAGFTDLALVAPMELQDGLQLVRSGSYTGCFVEDGSNAPCTDVLALLLTNTSDQFMEWIELALPVADGTAYFSVTSLPAGQSLLVMERTAMRYREGMEIGTPLVLQCSEAVGTRSLHPETFSITAADHVINLSNISDSDISGSIAICYKNVDNGIYLGGITYRKTLTDGVKAGGVGQFVCDNYTVAGSEIVFIVYEP